MPHMLVKRLKSVEQLTLSRNSTLMVSFYVLKNMFYYRSPPHRISKAVQDSGS